MIILGFLFIKIKSDTIRIIILVAFIIAQILYNLHHKYIKKQKSLGWEFLIILIFYLVIYTSIQTEEYKITFFATFIFAIISIGYNTIKSFFNLKKSKKLWEIILNYIFFAILIIIIFSLIFAYTNSKEENKIIDSDGKKIVETIEYIWFSSGNFYSCNFGEIPYGISKTMSYIEMMIALIIHVIVIGKVLNQKT